MSFISPEERELIAYRDSVNWRSVTRADPAVIQIINTCTFATIYIFDTGRDEWVKQKQEGPLFLVKRSKEPEYGLYMLNRAIVKNVLLPLIPGEIRVTPTSDSMLIVEKRGEGIKRGIHFGDGMSVVDQFRESIISICGDVRAKTVSGDKMPGHSKSEPPISTQSPAPPSAPVPAPASGSTGVEDDFQRLFGNLLKSSASSKSTISTTSQLHSQSQSPFNTASPQIQNIQPQTQTPGYRNATPPVLPPASSRPPPPQQLEQQQGKQPQYHQYQPQHLQRPATPPSPPITFSDHVTPSSAQAQNSRSPVPQTADDLLNSILGIGALPSRAQPPSSLPQSQPIPQAIRTPPPPQPIPNYVNGYPDQYPQHIQQQQQQLPRGISPVPSPMAQQRIRDRPPHLDHPPQPQSQAPPPPPPQSAIRTQDPELDGNGLLDHRGPLAEAITTSLPHNFPLGSRPGRAGDARLVFKLDLLDLIQRDPGFVDHLFHAFQARRGARG